MLDGGKEEVFGVGFGKGKIVGVGVIVGLGEGKFVGTTGPGKGSGTTGPGIGAGVDS